MSAHSVEDGQWGLPTPCTEWDARALVEHVIGFHEFLVLRPLGVHANSPEAPIRRRAGAATSAALFAALDPPGALDRATELPGGGESTPRTMLGALTTDVLVHTWDLARAADLDPALDPRAVRAAYEAARPPIWAAYATCTRRGAGTAGDADAATRLIALYGRDPAWVAAA